MPRWFITGPIDQADKTELNVYEALKSLDDKWFVCWTFYFLAGKTAKEGDFIILGPDGRLLVLEVKKSGRTHPGTGCGDGGIENQRDDAKQVTGQKEAVVKLFKEKISIHDKRELSFIAPALFSTIGNGFVAPTTHTPIAEFRGIQSIRDLATHWQSLFAQDKLPAKIDDVRSLFLEVYGDSSAAAEAKFLRSTDRLILDRLAADMSLLDSLAENQQILVRGGAGSGKTWLAERLAQQWAGEGKKVLFLCYNKALGNDLAQDLDKTFKGGGGTGSITVHTWESLADWLAKSLPKDQAWKINPPEQRDNAYYEKNLPSLMEESVLADGFKASFDALVVDEAQDHNTDWWQIYFFLLHEGRKSRVGIFHDPAQRPRFRNKAGSFDVRKIAKDLSQPAHFHVRTTRRYTRPVFDFLRGLDSPETETLVGGLHDDGTLLAGPEVIHRPGMAGMEQAKIEAGKILGQWLKEGLLEASDVLILTRHDPFTGKTPWFVNGMPFAAGIITPADDKDARGRNKLRVTSFHKAKGLDARAVVLLDTYAWDDLGPGDREGFWTAASRARQLLVIVEMKKVTKQSRISAISF